MLRVTMKFILCIALLILVFSGIPPASVSASNGIKVFRIETEALTERTYGLKPISDYYINGGEDAGFTNSMILDVYRKKILGDPLTGKKFEVSILVGQIKILNLYKNVAIARLVALTYSFDTPVLQSRSVMIGDYVVPGGSALDLSTEAKKEDSQEDAQKAEKKPEPLSEAVLIPSNVLFKLGNSNLTPTAMEALSVIHENFNPSKDKYILIEGHTCILGTDAYNMELSKKRAQSVSDYFVNSKGIPKDRIRITYHGKKLPVASNDTEEGRKKNRRVNIRFLPHDTEGTRHSQL
jgi:outer membrane protein OmpA-like peptidoglycan-associated protein